MLPLSLPGQHMVFSGSWATQCESKLCVLGQNHFLSDKTLGFAQLREIKVDQSVPELTSPSLGHREWRTGLVGWVFTGSLASTDRSTYGAGALSPI